MDEKNYKNLVILFSRYVNSKSRKMMILYYHELMGRTEEQEGKNI